MAGGWRVEISITPVQWFLARARRTRDLWGGSYLLSWLAAHAVAGAEEAGGKLIRPHLPRNELICFARGEGSVLPRYGSVPNHLVFEVTGEEEARKVARAAQARAMAAWEGICERVWEEFLEPVAREGNGTREIWMRQVGGFWEFSWVAYQGGDQGRVMARRKMWRTHLWPDEGGDKCMVLPEFQELSGWSGYTQGDKQRRFWSEFVQGLAKKKLAGAFELSWGEEERGPKEKVCAITAVKRLFGVLEEFSATQARNWPSTAYMAALPWVALAQGLVPELTGEYAELICGEVGEDDEFMVLCERPREWLGKKGRWQEPFARLDGRYYFLRVLASAEAAYLLGEDSLRVVGGGLQELYRALEEELEKIAPGACLPWYWPRPCPYYAFLLADGDRLGKMVKCIGPEGVGEALGRFGREVPGIVREYWGRVIYCGGDDLLAILPMTGALGCAKAIRDCFVQAFEGKATISAAVVFANMALPVGGVLAQARRLLEDHAKEASGRDSLAVGLVRRGGLSAMWVSRWDRDPCGLLERIAEAYRLGEMAASGVYRLRTLLARLLEGGRWEPGRAMDLPEGMSPGDARKFIALELGGERMLEEDLATNVVKAVVEGEEKGVKVVVDPLLLGLFLGRPPLEEG